MGCAQSDEGQCISQSATTRTQRKYSQHNVEALVDDVDAPELMRKSSASGHATKEPSTPLWWMDGFRDVHEHQLRRMAKGEDVSPAPQRLSIDPESPAPEHLIDSVEQWLESSHSIDGRSPAAVSCFAAPPTARMPMPMFASYTSHPSVVDPEDCSMRFSGTNMYHQENSNSSLHCASTWVSTAPHISAGKVHQPKQAGEQPVARSPTPHMLQSPAE